jgi:DNA-binding MarR family transcriptional regulator
VLRVIGERPGVTARELAAATRVTGGTLYALLRRLTDDGTIAKRELPGGQAGYALATSAGAAAVPAAAPAATAKAGPGVESLAAAEREHDRAESTQTGDAARSAATEAQPSKERRNEPSDVDETPTPSSDR